MGHGLTSHQHADDIQMYGCSEPEAVSQLVRQIIDCFFEIATWASSNLLCLNSDKTDMVHYRFQKTFNS